MRTVRIFQAGTPEVGQTVTLTEEAGQHVGVVLRMSVGARITLFSGDNRELESTVVSVHKKKVQVYIDAVTTVNRESPRSIHLAQAISKGDRMEWVIQKACELGVKHITPLTTSHCVVRLDAARLEKKQQQWHAIAVSACEQCGRNELPILHPLMSFDAYLQQCAAATKLILHPNAATTWRDLSLDAGDIALVIGPEGGLSEEEVAHALANQFTAMRLGPRVLRTETAAITALSVLQAVSGDL